LTKLPPAKQIVIATIGSLGDLHPCLAVGQELLRRGNKVTIASTPYYRRLVEELGLAFHPIRPDWNPTDRQLIASCEDLKKGLEVLYRKMVLPELKGTYEDLLAVAAKADVLIAGELVYAAPLVAEKLGLPWVSLILSPFSFFSSIDPSVTPNLPQLVHLRKAGSSVYRLALTLGKIATRHWSNPIRRLRREEGLQAKCDPVFRDKFSPYLVLALFSQWFASKQSDWPIQTLQTGFVPFVTQRDVRAFSKLTKFLSSGTAPVVFTQGSTAVHNPRDFYTISLMAAKRLGLRTVLLGKSPSEESDQDDILTLPYMPYSEVFPFARINVHQGGSGTVGEALKAGRPMLVVPYGWDQPDNAARLERLGVGLRIPRNEYTLDASVAALKRLLEDSRFSSRSAEIGARLATENSLVSACEAIESLLAKWE
jgi:rhamnosyltransferase subunit B